MGSIDAWVNIWGQHWLFLIRGNHRFSLSIDAPEMGKRQQKVFRTVLGMQNHLRVDLGGSSGCVS